MKVVVYKIFNSFNDRIYFGISQEYEKRRRSHINQLRLSEHNNYYLQKDWNAFGEESFTFEVVKRFNNRESAEEFEMEIINKTENVYNVVRDTSVGGDYFTHNPRKEQIRAERSKLMSGKNNHQYGKPKTQRMIDATKEANSKRVIVEGVEYSSMSEAAKVYGVAPGTVGNRCRSNNPEFKEWKLVESEK